MNSRLYNSRIANFKYNLSNTPSYYSGVLWVLVVSSIGQTDDFHKLRYLATSKYFIKRNLSDQVTFFQGHLFFIAKTFTPLSADSQSAMMNNLQNPN